MLGIIFGSVCVLRAECGDVASRLACRRLVGKMPLVLSVALIASLRNERSVALVSTISWDIHFWRPLTN